MRAFICDYTGQQVEPGTLSTLRLDGPIATMLGGRAEIHLGPKGAAEFAAWLQPDTHEPEKLGSPKQPSKQA